MRGWNPLQWLQEHGGSVGAVATASWPQAVHGSGLVATADIARGDLLLSVPALRPHTPRVRPVYAGRLPARARQHSLPSRRPHSALALDASLNCLAAQVPAALSLTALPGPSEGNLHEGHRLCLRLLGERCRGPASRWHAWLSSLPTAFETPLHWPDADLEVRIPCTLTMHTPCTHHVHTMHTPCPYRAYTDLQERLRGCPALLARALEERAHLAPMLEALDDEDQAELRPEPCACVVSMHAHPCPLPMRTACPLRRSTAGVLDSTDQ